MADDEQPLIDLYRCVCLVTDTMLPLPLVEFLILFMRRWDISVSHEKKGNIVSVTK